MKKVHTGKLIKLKNFETLKKEWKENITIISLSLSE